MIRQVAIDPAALATWDRFRHFIDQCGPDRGRVIVEYPPDWRRRLWRLISTHPDAMFRKRVEVRLKQAAEHRHFVARPDAGFDEAFDWLVNATREHERRALDAIVADRPVDAPPPTPPMFDAAIVDESDPAWRAARTMRFRRTATGFASLLAPIIRLSREIVFVDPHLCFSTRDGRVARDASHVRVFKAVLDSDGSRAWSSVRYDFADLPNLPSPRWADLPGQIGDDLGGDVQLELVRHPHSTMHNRYVLTDVAGVQFGHSLAEATTSGVADDIASLLDAEQHRDLWLTFGPSAPPSPAAIVVRLPKRGDRLAAAGSRLGIAWRPR